MKDLQDDTKRPQNFWLDFFKEHRQQFIRQINKYLLEGAEYITFVVPTARLNFFFVPELHNKQCVVMHVLNNSFTTLRIFAQSFELAKNFVDACYLTLYYLHQLREMGAKLKPIKLEFTGFTAWRRRFKRQGKTMQSILELTRPVQQIKY